MQIANSNISDIEEIFKLYELATNFQKSKKEVVVWPAFERALVETEIAENRQWKLLINGEVACVWAITFSDEQIWEKRNQDRAIYIHRIATNPNFRGQGFVQKIVDWAKVYAPSVDKKFIRLDTMGNNVGLIELYKKAGFDFLGFFKLKNTDKLPEHYRTELPACLFEIDLNK